MEIVIHFCSGVRRPSVALHAWEPQGETWDQVARDPDGAFFTFTMKCAVADRRAVRFKFRFPEERRWEGDELTRTIPTRDGRELWTFDDSPRVMTRNPDDGTAPGHLIVRLLTRARFAGAALYAWQPGSDRSARFPEASRDAKDCVSLFDIPLDQADHHLDWMKGGFHFKFVDRDGRFEDDACNRVWRPADGGNLSVKSGQASLWTGTPAAKRVTITLLYPKALGAAPVLELVDISGDAYHESVAAASAPSPAPHDARFVMAAYEVGVFPEASYTVQLADPAIEGSLARPLRVTADDAGPSLRKLAIAGDARWLDNEPALAPVCLVFHPRPWTSRLARLAFEVGVGNAPAFDRVAAHREADGSWRADTKAPVGVVLQALPVADQPIDQRLDGPVSAQRRFELRQASPVELHTVDAQPGFIFRPGTAGVASARAVAP